MVSRASVAIALVVLMGSTQLSAGKELDTGMCCPHPGGAHRRALHAQDMRWETHGIRPLPTGERHVIERNWEID
jgi:hypothetical protein